MNQEFKDFLIRDMKSCAPEDRQEFLRMLKFKPDQVVNVISANIIGWGTSFVMKTGRVLGGYDIKSDIQSDAQELLRAYQEHFAEELGAINQ